MTLFKNIVWIRLSWRGFHFLATFLLTIAGISNLLEAAQSTSASERPSDSTLRNQTSPTRSVTADGDTRAGKELFEKYCVTCHGPRGRGDGLEIAGATVADLSSAATQRKLNVDLLTTIHEGRPGKVMPAWKWRLSEEQSKSVLAYIRTLQRK